MELQDIAGSMDPRNGFDILMMAILGEKFGQLGGAGAGEVV